jgi:hypothetical protein
VFKTMNPSIVKTTSIFLLFINGRNKMSSAGFHKPETVFNRHADHDFLFDWNSSFLSAFCHSGIVALRVDYCNLSSVVIAFFYLSVTLLEQFLLLGVVTNRIFMFN